MAEIDVARKTLVSDYLEAAKKVAEVLYQKGVEPNKLAIFYVQIAQAEAMSAVAQDSSGTMTG